MSNQADTLDLVLKATESAAHKHRNQRRKDANASPYINHPIALARVLRVDGGVDDAAVIAAALLHDIIANPPADWSVARKREYFDWAKRSSIRCGVRICVSSGGSIRSTESDRSPVYG